ncbi:MAG: hypothetical protein IJH34_03745 [Romboutsia sp.]|nr:hypothetical protein [Romboutsia sp.]
MYCYDLYSNCGDDFFKLLTDMSSLAVVIPYVVLLYAYIKFRKNSSSSLEFKFFKSDILAYGFAGIALILSCVGFFGAGLDTIMGTTGSEAALSILKTYGGPVILSLLGLAIRSISLRCFNKEHNTSEKIEKFVAIEETAE